MAKRNTSSNNNLVTFNAILWIVAVAFLLYCGSFWVFVFLTGPFGGSFLWFASMIIVGVLGVSALVAALGLSCMLNLSYLRDTRNAAIDTSETLRKLIASQTSSEAVLTQISENLLLSDSIKSVAFREKDREVMAEAVRQDMRAEQWESANILIAELEGRFGCKQLADDLRQEMKNLKTATKQEKVDGAISHVHSLWRIHRYEEALKEAVVLRKIYPKDQRVIALPADTEKHLQDHKKELLDRLNKAVEARDVDLGVEILKLLDNYLTPTEAAALKESARDVFRAKLQKLGVEFSLFVTEHKWDRALKVGREITAQFPNSRMAQEVREKIAVLQKRAEQSI